MSLGDIIAELRKDKGLQQNELAKMLNVTPATISNYERNTYKPDIDNLVKLANIFNCSTDYLLCRIRYNFDLKSLDNKFGEIDGKPFTMGDLLKRELSLNTESRNLLLGYLKLLTIKEKSDKTTALTD